MDESFALTIHKALHNWRGVEGTVDLLGDGEIVRCSAIKESKKTNAVESSDDQEEEEVGRPAEKNCVSSEGEADASEEEEVEEELDMSNLSNRKMDELRAFTKKQGIKVAGRRKDDVIKAIKKWNEQRKEEAKKKAQKKRPSLKEAAEAKKEVASSRKPASGDKAETIEQIQEEAEKGEKENEAMAEVESEANSQERKDERLDEGDDDGKEEDIDELDLDQLHSYSMGTLKRYCEAEEIAVSGVGKLNYIEAILDYNEDECAWWAFILVRRTD